MKAEAEFIVTGDRHLPVLGSHQAIQIVKPRQFLDLLR
jgi:predicted nucleic acid-binding protein